MPLLNWNDSFNLGIEEVDKQHRLLVDIINELYDALRAGQDKATLKATLSRMVNYAAFHFAREEHYFETLSYPRTEAHKKEHMDFEDQVTAFVDDFSAGRQDLTTDILSFLGDWLVKHIQGSDRHYAGFLQARGVR